jgi:hypothetical protein
MTNNDWNTVDWDDVPDDVDAVITYKHDVHTYCKINSGVLDVQCWRDDAYEESCILLNTAKEIYGDLFHLRPTPASQPIPEPPESTQVDSSEVEATTTPEFNWSSVEDDVEAVVVSPQGRLMAVFKEETNHLLIGSGSGRWYVTRRSNTIDKYPLGQLKTGNGILIRRPPAITTPEVDMYDMFKGADSKPSISMILHEAQQSILKHHGVTGEVKFTVTCS